MLQARDRLKRVRNHSHGVIWVLTCSLMISLTAIPTPSTAATTFSKPIRGVIAVAHTSPPIRHALSRPRVKNAPPRRLGNPVVVELSAFTSAPTPTDGYVVSLIHRDFPPRAW